MNLEALHALIEATTVPFRKDGQAAIEQRKVGDLNVIEVNHDKTSNDVKDMETVDVFFFNVAIVPGAILRKPELISLLKDWEPAGELAGGPSYITAGGRIGSQEAALRLFGLGQALGLWRIIKPDDLGFEGDEAKEMAGVGYVLCTGLK